MGKSTAKYELLFLYDKLGLEPKKLNEWLISRGQRYSLHTLRKYYQYYATAKMITESILRS